MSGREILRTGDIVIRRRTGILGWGAKLLGWGYQHAGLLRVAKTPKGRVHYILEAVMPTIRPRALQERDWPSMDVYRVKGATPEDGEKAWRAGLFYVGQWYGLPKAARLVLRRVVWLLRRLKPAYMVMAAMPVFCSELCTVSWREGPGKDPVPGMDAKDVSPQDLAESPATERVYL